MVPSQSSSGVITRLARALDGFVDRLATLIPPVFSGRGGGSGPRNWRAREFALLRRRQHKDQRQNQNQAQHQGHAHTAPRRGPGQAAPSTLTRWMPKFGRGARNRQRPPQSGQRHEGQEWGGQGAAAQAGRAHANGGAHPQPPFQSHPAAPHLQMATAAAQHAGFHPGIRSTEVAMPRDPQRARVFRRAKRHSILVRGLRYSLPVTALVLLALLPLSAVTPSIPGFGNLSLDGIGFSGTTIVMENPRLNGFEEGRGGYQFEAERAEQNVTESNKVMLTGLNGRITQEDGRWASIRARQGLIDTEAETMILERDIIVRAEGGYRAFLQTADVELKDGNVRTDQPVQVDMLNGSVKAQSLELIERGRYILFDGDVKMTIYLGAVQEAGGGSTGSAATEAPQAVSGAAQ